MRKSQIRTAGMTMIRVAQVRKGLKRKPRMGMRLMSLRIAYSTETVPKKMNDWAAWKRTKRFFLSIKKKINPLNHHSR